MVNLINRISEEKEKNLLFLKYVQRIPDEETLIKMKLKDNKSLERLHRLAIERAGRMAAQDEFLSAIFFEQVNGGVATVPLSAVNLNHHHGLLEEPEWSYNLTTEQMKDIVRNTISKWKTETYRRVIELRLLEGKSTEETAEEMGVTPGKVYNYLNIAYKRLLTEIKTIKINTMPERSKQTKKITLDQIEKILDGSASAEESLAGLSAAVANEEVGELLTSETPENDKQDIRFFNNMFAKYEDEIKRFIEKREKGKVVNVDFKPGNIGVAAALPPIPSKKKKKK